MEDPPLAVAAEAAIHGPQGGDGNATGDQVWGMPKFEAEDQMANLTDAEWLALVSKGSFALHDETM